MNLVVQGAPLAHDTLSELAAMVEANHVVTLAPGAWRLTGVRETAAVEAWCAERTLDCAWVPETRRLADLRLVALDMDSTLVTVESIDELAEFVGAREAVAALTERAMRGELAYGEALAQRLALLAGLEVAALERVCKERLHLSPGAERLVARCRSLRVHTLLVSGSFAFFTDWLRTRLGIDEALANLPEVRDGRLTGRLAAPLVDAAAKAAKLAEVMRREGLEAAQVLAVGDGANDLPMMALAGVSVAYRAKPVVRDRATHALDHAPLDGVLNLYL